eukprot:CAMPEP_0198228648 /NCGR_PEP_ID=MMETSP1445-20131203/113705_1 /TAXON_ID=36898 /ORGANISM="Pyramimonas sp., Strain CCMP2087" /LENGTH=105 /DNA_ID=CAMNT_0043909061 /DNA_START=1494 /DNA_END=1811 /DNA_ORIENTATION=-
MDYLMKEIDNRQREASGPSDAQITFLMSLWEGAGTPERSRVVPVTMDATSDAISSLLLASPQSRNARPPSEKQLKLLARYGVPAPTTLGAATKMLDVLMSKRRHS